MPNWVLCISRNLARFPIAESYNTLYWQFLLFVVSKSSNYFCLSARWLQVFVLLKAFFLHFFCNRGLPFVKIALRISEPQKQLIDLRTYSKIVYLHKLLGKKGISASIMHKVQRSSSFRAFSYFPMGEFFFQAPRRSSRKYGRSFLIIYVYLWLAGGIVNHFVH